MKPHRSTLSIHHPRHKWFWKLGAICLAINAVACTTIKTNRDDGGSLNGGVIIPANFDQALRENQKALTDNKARADVALYNIGMLSAHSTNPKKDYMRALSAFKTLVKDYPNSPRTEPAKIWIESLEFKYKTLEDGQKIADEKRSLARERDQLAQDRLQVIQERNKLNYALEKSRQLDAEIEKRRKQSLKR